MLRNSNYVYGPKDIKVPASLNLGEYLLENISKYQDRVAFIDADTHEKTTYKEILHNAVNLAMSLTQLGIKKGDVVALCSENRREFWPTVVGTICTGATFTPISISYTNEEIKHTLNISKPKFIFCSPMAYKTHRSVINSQKFIKKVILYGDKKVSSELLYSDLVANDIKIEDFIPVPVDGQSDTVAILYSSGTTGLPKGVMLTHYNVIVFCSSNASNERTPEVTSITLAPWYHAFGLWANMAGMIDGKTRIFLKRFSEQLFLETIHKYRPLTLSVVPPIIVLLSKSQILENYDVSSVKFMYCGAAPLDISTINDVKKKFPNLQAVIQGFGMTESTLSICSDSADTFISSKQGGVGVPTPTTIIKIADLETRKPLGPNQPGEICVKSGIIMKGYVGKDRSEAFDEEDFYKTGDIGYYDEDQHFFIIDRLKELIKYKGFQVPPAEVEAELLKHPAVRDAGVVGIPDKAAGELPLAFIVKQPGQEVTEEEIQAYVASKLSNPKHLRGGVRFVNEIPKNPSGKIIRRLLRNMTKTTKSKL